MSRMVKDGDDCDALKVTISETDIGVLRFCYQTSVAGASGTSNNVLSIDVVGEFVLFCLVRFLTSLSG